MTGATPKKKLGVLKLAGKITASFLFGVVLLEIGLRFVPSCPPAPAPEADFNNMPIDQLIEYATWRSWIHRPSSESRIKVPGDAPDIVQRRDWCGCREDDDTPLEKPPGVYRTLVQGDSHTDGSVENRDSYANILERQLGTGFDVMNCGQSVSSPYQQYWIYRQLYSRFDPDFLIIGFYAGNDLGDLMIQNDRIHLERSGEEFVHAEPTWRADQVREQSPFAVLLYRHLAIARAAAKLRWLATDHIRQQTAEYFDPLITAKDLYPAPTWQGLNQSYYFKHFPEDWKVAADMLRFVLSQYKRDAPKQGLLVVVIPTYRQIRPSVAVAPAELLQLSPYDQECDERVCDLAVEICGALDIDVLDMRPAMKQYVGDLFWDFDHHINGNGHRLIAEELLRRLSVPK